MDSINPLITAENENYTVLFPGVAKHTGAGLAVMAGLAIETQMLEFFRKSDNASTWKVNRVVLAHDQTSGLQKRGLLGRSQQAALFLYRGNWPNKMAGEARENFSGTVSDDSWHTVPRFDPDSVVHIPYGIKEAIFEDTAWASNSAKEAEADEQKRQKDVEAGLEEDGDLPTDSKGSKKNKKHIKKDRRTPKRTPKRIPRRTPKRRTPKRRTTKITRNIRQKRRLWAKTNPK